MWVTLLILWTVDDCLQIGQALRIALTYGLHRERPAESSQGPFAARCRDVWWTIYILDRNFSSSMGVPTSIQDQDITASLPSLGSSSRREAAMRYQVKLSRILAQVVDSERLLDQSMLI